MSHAIGCSDITLQSTARPPSSTHTMSFPSQTILICLLYKFTGTESCRHPLYYHHGQISATRAFIMSIICGISLQFIMSKNLSLYICDGPSVVIDTHPTKRWYFTSCVVKLPISTRCRVPHLGLRYNRFVTLCWSVRLDQH